MSKISYMTPSGFEKLKKELDDLKTNGRQKAAKAIAEAREKGDLSENAEYDAAKDAQGMLEMKINQLEKSLANARVLDTAQMDNSVVTILSTVTIKNLKIGKSLTYQIVSEAEANLKEKKISSTSPIGQGLMGKAVGEIAKIKTPAGEMDFEVVSIEFI